VAVVQAAGAQSFEKPVAAFEVHAVAASHGDVPQGRGEECFADTDGSHDHCVVTRLDETQRNEFVPDGAVVADFGGVVPQLEAHGSVKSSGAGPQVGGGGLAAGDLVGEDEL
jgi:hypothetical protein